MILAALDPTIAGALITSLLGGTAIAAVAAFRKAGPEAGAIATGSLISVNQELRTEIGRLTGIVHEQRIEIDSQAQQLRSQGRQLEDAEQRLGSMREELDRVQKHLNDLKP